MGMLNEALPFRYKLRGAAVYCMCGYIVVRRYQYGIAFAVCHGHCGWCVAIELYHFGAFQYVFLVRK